MVRLNYVGNLLFCLTRNYFIVDRLFRMMIALSILLSTMFASSLLASDVSYSSVTLSASNALENNGSRALHLRVCLKDVSVGAGRNLGDNCARAKISKRPGKNSYASIIFESKYLNAFNFITADKDGTNYKFWLRESSNSDTSNFSRFLQKVSAQDQAVIGAICHTIANYGLEKTNNYLRNYTNRTTTKNREIMQYLKGSRAYPKWKQISDRCLRSVVRKTGPLSVMRKSKSQKNEDVKAVCGYTTTSSLSRSQLKQVQYGLKRHGLYGGAIDGIFGKKSCDALKRFMDCHGTSTNRLDSGHVYNLSSNWIKPTNQEKACYEKQKDLNQTFVNSGRSNSKSLYASQSYNMMRVEPYDGRKDGGKWIGAWIKLFGVSGSPLKNQLHFELSGNYPSSAPVSIGLSDRFTLNYIPSSVAHRKNDKFAGNRYFITPRDLQIGSFRQFVKKLSAEDRSILEKVCGTLSNQTLVHKIVDELKTTRRFDQTFRDYWSDKNRVQQISDHALDCMNALELDTTKIAPQYIASAGHQIKRPSADFKNCAQDASYLKTVQGLLKNLGFYQSKVDGIDGPGTQRALVQSHYLLGDWADQNTCMSVTERRLLYQLRSMRAKNGLSCDLHTKKQAEVELKRLKDAGLTNIVEVQNIWQYTTLLELVERLKSQLLSSGFYKGSTKDLSANCRISAAELRELVPKPVAVTGCNQSNLKACNASMVCVGATKNIGSKKVWDKDSSTGAIWFAEAKRRKLDCNVSELNKLAEANVCNQSNLKACNASMVCIGATKNIGSKKVWDEDSSTGAIWFAEAKRRKLDCNVVPTIVASKQSKTCDDDPALCSVIQLCGKAASTVNGDRAWNTDAKAADYVAIAKSTGVTCGVKPRPVVVAKAPICEDDPAFCSVVQLCGKAASTVNGDRAWNTDAKAAEYVALAKSTGVTCGVKPKPVAVAKAPTCEDDPTKCSVIELCQQATGTNASGEKFWRMDAELQTYVDVAKSTGMTCGVNSKAVETAQLETCENTPAKCSLTELCQRAISFETGKLGWATTESGTPYVQFAKNFGMTCGVQEEIVAVIPEQKQVEPPAPKKVLKYTNRKALVIGNANYVDQTPLKNPINDAKAVAAKLEQIGFEVTYKENLKVREFGRTLGNFEREVASSDISLIYYAGHGIEVDSVNYLIPVDAELSNPSDVKFETVMLDDAVGASLNTGKLSMVLVDACRDNPFAKSMTGGSRSVGRGLSIVDAQPGKIDQIISFAAESGEVAEDGTGNNSPYATALLELLDEPNLEVGKLFRKLGDNVERMTNGKQIPVTRNRLSGEDIYLVVE